MSAMCIDDMIYTPPDANDCNYRVRIMLVEQHAQSVCMKCSIMFSLYSTD